MASPTRKDASGEGAAVVALTATICHIESSLLTFLRQQPRISWRMLRLPQLLKHAEGTLALLAEVRSVLNNQNIRPGIDPGELNIERFTALREVTAATRPEWIEEMEGSLKRVLLLLHLHDVEYLHAQLLYEVDSVDARRKEPEPREPEPLGELVQADLKNLVAQYGSGDCMTKGWNDRACQALCSAHDQKIAQERLRRTRIDVRGRYLAVVACVLFALLVGLLIAIVNGIIHDWPPLQMARSWTSSELLIAPIAGALGAVLSHMRRVRDEYTKIRQILSQALWAQVFAGAAAGSVLLLIVRSPLNPLDPVKIPVGGWPSAGVLGFLGGFSEPFLINIVGRLTGLGEKRSAANV